MSEAASITIKRLDDRCNKLDEILTWLRDNDIQDIYGDEIKDHSLSYFIYNLVNNERELRMKLTEAEGLAAEWEKACHATEDLLLRKAALKEQS